MQQRVEILFFASLICHKTMKKRLVSTANKQAFTSRNVKLHYSQAAAAGTKQSGSTFAQRRSAPLKKITDKLPISVIKRFPKAELHRHVRSPKLKSIQNIILINVIVYFLHLTA